MFKLNPPVEIKPTKRGILSLIARLFEPIGFTVRAKIGIQRLWQRGLEWDQELPTTVREEWIRFFQEMKNLNKVNVTFERPLTPMTSLEVIKAATLCIFSDVSNEAFGACVYIRWQTKSNYLNIRFIAAKSRVAILKTADCTSSRATRSSTGNQAISVHHWGNTSEIHESRTLHRQQYSVVVDPQSCQRTQAICIRRIAEIQSNSDPCQWRHVLEEFNV